MEQLESINSHPEKFVIRWPTITVHWLEPVVWRQQPSNGCAEEITLSLGTYQCFYIGFYKSCVDIAAQKIGVTEYCNQKFQVGRNTLNLYLI